MYVNRSARKASSEPGKGTRGQRHIYSIIVMSDANATNVAAAFVAGADDLLRRPFIREELIARVVPIEPGRRRNGRGLCARWLS
jgi:DNA-binding response OmpR family regulator